MYERLLNNENQMTKGFEQLHDVFNTVDFNRFEPKRKRDNRHFQQLKGDLDAGIDQAIRWLKQNQAEDGYWAGHVETNSCMEAQWILAMHFLGIKNHPKHDGVVKSILDEQRSDGSWEVYFDAPQGDINTTVECYAALRTAGLDKDREALKLARNWILAHGGLRRIRVFTKFWLALIGEWSWDATPALPPEIIFLPSWCPFSIYDFASWARATLVPLSILSSRRPVHHLPENQRLDELFPEGRTVLYAAPAVADYGFSWKSLFLFVDRILNKYTSLRWQPGRNAAKRFCTEWIIKHQDADGVWGGIQPPWLYSLMALHVEGYPLTHPVMVSGLKAFDSHWMVERNGGIYLQASMSPVWDTLLSLLALQDCGLDCNSHPFMMRALQWILGKQVTAHGDWQARIKGVRPGGWAFEHENIAYPDVDDTAVALIVLSRAKKSLKDTSALDEAISQATEWMLGLQSRNGGWAAFDKDNENALLTKIPFCDFGEVLDPPSADLTAHAVEALAWLGYPKDFPAMEKAIRFLKKEQETMGSWFGRWGVNHIYGTGAVLPALHAAGENMEAPYIRKAADWIKGRQNSDGGWGETCSSYMDDSLRGVGESTASQTGWALLCLLAMQSPSYDESIGKGIRYLLDTQKNGGWEEPHYTGTGFPGYGLGARVQMDSSQPSVNQGVELERGFMIKYDLYRQYFPLMALGRARKRFEGPWVS